MSVVNLTSDNQRGGAEVKVSVVLQDTLEKLKSAAPKRLKELRDECDLGLEKLKASSATSSVNADEFFKALKLACESSGSPKVVSIALDSIQKLITNGFLIGKGADPFKEPAAGSHRCLIDSVIDCVCNCAENIDDQVQLQMIRALLAAVTSQTCEVHGDSLMSAVRTCFMIHKDSKNSMNQRTAQASLTQMLTVVTQRMEVSSVDMSRRTASFDESSGRQAEKHPPSDLALQTPSKLLEDFMGSYVTRLVDEVVLKQHGDGTAEQIMRSSGETIPPGKFGWCVICRQSAAHYCVDTKERYGAIDPVCSKNCKFRNLERTELVEAHFGSRHEDEQVDPAHDICNGDTVSNVAESEASSSPPSSVTAHSLRAASLESTAFSETSDGSSDVKMLNQHAQDALMVFKSLCRLSMKDLPTGQSDTRIVRSKRLSLELVLGMIQHCGPVFRSSVPFINEIKQLLCHSLIKNSVSSIPKIFVLSLRIFVMLITNFKDHLKAEIGVFIEQIFLRILESGNSTFYHKNHVLQVFYKLCTDASTALELFLNFDCDVDEKNVFERMMDCLSKIAQGRYTAVEHANLIQPDQEKELKMLSLQAMVTLMGSIVDWARRMAEDHKKLNIEDGDLGMQEKGTEADSDAEDDTTSNATFDTSSTLNPSSIVEQKQRKLELQIGVNKFNMKPKRGIEYLKQNGFVSDDPKAIAELFKNAEIGLDKTQVGDYLGEDKPLNKSVLYALVDSQDFKETELDMALRQFLSVFRLPGEAQKIDRMMEKFAEKYCQDNAGKFANADCAFVLSFSLIMLQTDLHNPGIKNKMSKEAFVRNNRGINDNNDLPKEYLESLYDAVLNHPISLKEDEDARTRLESLSAQGASQKYELFVRETESIVQKSQELMKQKGQKNASYVAAHSVEHVRPLFEVACWPMLATLAVLLEMQDQPNSVDLCIEGFKHCIRIAARFDMDTERDAFVSSLAKFTYLTTLKEMKQKNIDCIKALLSIGLNEGNDLGPSWQYVLHCISQLERLQLIGMKTRQDFQFFQGDDESAGQTLAMRSMSTISATSTSGTQVLKRRAYGTGVSALMSIGQDDRQVELVNSESVLHQIDGAQIELLFNRSASLSSGAIVHFVTQLARVSKEELALHDQSRIFSLQKLVEVADYNMVRMRVVWSRIWRVLSTHFVEVILHPNKSVSMYAVDSLRQLANKFLEKDELSNYNFQAEFLRPFEVVMTKQHDSINKDCKELIIQIIVQMVQKNRKNIKSGWKTVFHILHAAAQDAESEAFSGTAFPVMQMVLEPETYHLFVDNFADGVRTLLAFGHCKADVKVSMEAIKYLLQAAAYLADKDKPDPPLPPALLTAEAGQGNSNHPAAHWFPILRGLSMLVADPRREIRTQALNAVFDSLREHGSTVFDEEAWRMVFNGVIKPLFDDIFHQLQDGTTEPQNPSRLGPPTCLLALTALVKVFVSNLESLAFLMEDILKLLKTCIQHETEAVARIGVEGFKQLFLGSAIGLKPATWTQVTAMIKQLFEGSMPEMLLKFSDADLSAGNGTLPFSKDYVVTQCVVQLLLIDMLQDAVAQYYDHIPPQGIMELLDALQRSFEFAQEFNQKLELRQALKRLGFMKEMKQLPGLLKQEREALSCSLKVLFQVQNDERMLDSEFAPQALERLMMLCKNVLKNYANKERLVQESTDACQDSSAEGRERETVTVEMEREVLGLVPIISEVVLRGLKDMDSKHTARFAAELFPLLCELTIVQSRDVRLMVREILLEQIGPLLKTN